MKVTAEQDAKISKMTFASIYPMYVQKVERKGRTEEELLQVIEWLCGFSKEDVKQHIDTKIDFKTFFEKAKLNANANLIKGVICGYRVEEIEFPLRSEFYLITNYCQPQNSYHISYTSMQSRNQRWVIN